MSVYASRWVCAHTHSSFARMLARTHAQGSKQTNKPLHTLVRRGVETLSNADITRCVVMGKTSFIFLPAISIFLFMCILGGWHLYLILTNQVACVRVCVRARERARTSSS